MTKPAARRTRSARVEVPPYVEPCLARLLTEPPVGSEWVHEIKFDGYRIQAHVENGVVRLATRKGLDWTVRFAKIAEALGGLRVQSALIDGEIVVEDEHGRSSFVRLVDDLKAGRSARMVYMAFDLLYLDGEDLRGLPLRERKSKLHPVVAGLGERAIRYSEHLSSDGRAMLDEVCRLGLEGIVSKRLDKPYRSGRTGDWVKAKCKQSDELVIAGYLDSTAIANAVGALVLGFYDGRQLIYAGRVGTGFTHRKAAELWSTLQKLRVANSPFGRPLATQRAKGVRWVSPKLVAQVQYRAWTGDGLLRQASFEALREDKPARDVTRPPSHPAS